MSSQDAPKMSLKVSPNWSCPGGAGRGAYACPLEEDPSLDVHPDGRPRWPIAMADRDGRPRSFWERGLGPNRGDWALSEETDTRIAEANRLASNYAGS